MTSQTARAMPGAIWMVLGAIASVQLGAAVAKNLFGVVPPVTMAWLRLAAAAVALLVLGALARARRPSAGSGAVAGTGAGNAAAPARSWRDGLAYAVCLVGMNVSIYEAFARLPLGLAVTLEFLGPLGLSVLGSRRARDVLWALLALAGVALLGFTPTGMDPVGVFFALLAGALWAGYIATAARAGRTWASRDALTLACGLGAVALAVPAIAQGGAQIWRPDVLLAGAGVGLLSSVIPYSLEMVALKSIPPRVFGILMSLEPAAAALAALILLGEKLSPTDLLAMGCVIVASIGATRSA
ncbi:MULTISPECIES: EamA family transporter [unclassified Luteococcus]|uniref:EamA family transporter n=1 Tax=unclassified Luteococcus TaxID=2639923 RepID=UPI00313E23C9